MSLLTVFLILWTLFIIMGKPSDSTGFTIDNTLPLRGLLAVLIIVHHTSQRLTYSSIDTSWCRYLYQFNTWGYLIVSVFFFLTGYGLMKSYMIKKEIYLADFIRKRITKIITPFAISIIIYNVANAIVAGNVINISFEAWKQDCPLLPNSWYVMAIIIFYMVFYIFAKTVRKEWRIILCLFLFTLIYMSVLSFLGFKRYWWFTTPCISLGMIIACKESFLSSLLKKKRLCVCCMLLLWLLTFTIDPQYYSHSVDEITALLICIARSLSIALFIYVCISVAGFVNNTTSRFLGKISYEIYLVQGGVIGILFPYLDWNPIAFITISILSSILLAYMLKKACNHIV